MAFGGDGPTIPLPLDANAVHQNLGQQQVRLVKEWLPDQTWRPSGADGDRHKYWVYQYRNDTTLAWNSFYAFLEMEFTPTDWLRVNAYTSEPGFIHMETIIVVKFLGRGGSASTQKTSDDVSLSSETMEIYGKRMLVDGVVKENLGGRTKVLFECHTEQARVQALKDLFDIELTDDERNGIKGWSKELVK